MGYLGFGMRKEVYTRKAKKAFSKIKKVYRDGSELPSSNIKFKTNKKASYKKHSYKPFYKGKTYKAIKFTVLSCTAAFLIWDFFIKEHYYQYEQRKFEERGFMELYNEDLKHFDQVFKYMSKNQDRIVSLGYNWNNRFDIKLKHPKTVYDSVDFIPKKLSFNGDYNTNHPTNIDSIHNEFLLMTRNNYQFKYLNNWVYNLKNVKNDQIPKSVKSYLHLSNTTLNNVIKSSKFSYEFYNGNESVTCLFKHPNFGKYELTYCNTKPKNHKYEKNGDTYNVIFGKLDENTYWSKEIELESK